VNSIRGIAVTWLSFTDLTNLNSGEGGSNLVDIKKFKYKGAEYPYVSGQAMRAYLKESIRRDLQDKEYMCIPDAKGETCGDVTRCIQCDLFGYMIPKKKRMREGKQKAEGSEEENETAGGALTRVSPVKVAPAIGQFPFYDNSTLDFLTRRKPQEKSEEKVGDIVNVELGKNVYKGGIDVDVSRVGRMEEINVNDRSVTFKALLNEEQVASRIRKVLEAIRFMSDYSKQARLLTDFTPDVICISFQRRYSHRLQKLFEFNGYDGPNPNRIRDILSDVKDYSGQIYFGLTSGVILNEERIIDTVQAIGITVERPDEVISSALKSVD
jgi:CRISPR-associated protein Cst2